MILKDISFENPKNNILFDDLLLKTAEYGNGVEVLRFWESKVPFIVLGRVSKISEDINLEEAIRDNIPILRRSSGGGTVIQGKGCINFSLILSKKACPQICDLKGSYRYILEKVIKALNALNVQADFFPISDIALILNKKKISGNAQRRMRDFILHHGTILYDFDLGLIEKYLKLPKKMPEYRDSRSHLDFVDNVKIDINDFKKELGHIFNIDIAENSLSEKERDFLSSFPEMKV